MNEVILHDLFDDINYNPMAKKTDFIITTQEYRDVIDFLKMDMNSIRATMLNVLGYPYLASGRTTA